MGFPVLHIFAGTFATVLLISQPSGGEVDLSVVWTSEVEHLFTDHPSILVISQLSSLKAAQVSTIIKQ